MFLERKVVGCIFQHSAFMYSTLPLHRSLNETGAIQGVFRVHFWDYVIVQYDDNLCTFDFPIINFFNNLHERSYLIQFVILAALFLKY